MRRTEPTTCLIQKFYMGRCERCSRDCSQEPAHFVVYKPRLTLVAKQILSRLGDQFQQWDQPRNWQPLDPPDVIIRKRCCPDCCPVCREFRPGQVNGAMGADRDIESHG